MNLTEVFRQLRSVKIQRIFKEPVLLFTASRYLGYAMLFARGLLLANFLGPTLFGTWGFITLVEQYLTYTNFGIQYAVTVELSTGIAKSNSARNRIISSALLVSVILSTAVIAFGLWMQIQRVELFQKYSFNQYVLLLGIWVGLLNLKQVFVNIYRVYNSLLRIAISELLIAFIPLVIIFFLRGEALITASLASIAFACMLSILIFIYKPPFEWSREISKDIIYSLFLIGVPLLIYNVSYTMITLVGRTILSAFYTNEQMGYYSFANSLTNATLLGFNAILWVAFPSVLYRTRTEVDNQKAGETVKKVNDLFNTSVFISVFLTIIFSPLLFRMLPQYKPAEEILSILLLSQAMLLLSFGYNSLAIARKKQMQVALISLVAVTCVSIIGLLVSLLKFPASWVASAVLAGSFIFTVIQVRLGYHLIQPGGRLSDYFLEIFSLGTILSVVISYIGTMTNFTFWSASLALLIYVLTNHRKVKLLWGYILQRFS